MSRDVIALSVNELMTCSILIERNCFNTFVVDSFKNQSIDEAQQDDLSDDQWFGYGFNKGRIYDDPSDPDGFEFDEYVKDGPVYSPIVQRARKAGSLRRAQAAVDAANSGVTMEEHNEAMRKQRHGVQVMRLEQTLKYALRVAKSPFTVDSIAQTARQFGLMPTVRNDVMVADRRVVKRIRAGVVLSHPDGTLARVSCPGQYRAKVGRYGFSEVTQ